VVLDSIISHTIPLVFDFQHGFEARERTHLFLVVLQHTTTSIVGVRNRIIVGSRPGRRVLVLSLLHPQDAVCSGQHLCLGFFSGRVKENEGGGGTGDGS
jgi:hypothetical protein